MLKTILHTRQIVEKGIRSIHHPLKQTTLKKEISARKDVNYEILKNVCIKDDMAFSDEKPKSVLESCDEDLSYVAPYLKPTFNFAAYVNRSETLQELLKLGVNLYKLEKKGEIQQYILGLEFERDIKNHVLFLHNLGFQVDEIGDFITINPNIFKESLDDLKTRINYLKYKNFNDEMILRIVSTNPLWLQFKTPEIDERLGFFQKQFSLSGSEVRLLTVKKPKLITYSLKPIKINIFVIKEEMGFNKDEAKAILLDSPGIFMKNQLSLLKTFEYLHKIMNISLEDIVKTPKILTCREHKLKERYLFLKKLNRIQFNPKEANFISLQTLVSGPDSYFATEVAKSSIQAYNEFLKTL